MEGRYAELIEKTSREFADGLLADVEYLIDVGDELDGFVLDELRAVAATHGLDGDQGKT